jgi:HEAT repeat protein
LAYVGDAQCAEELVRLTTDREWWVRFRSAQALFQLPGLSAAFIVERVAQTGDRYAIQMVHAVQVAQGQHHG